LSSQKNDAGSPESARRNLHGKDQACEFSCQNRYGAKMNIFKKQVMKQFNGFRIFLVKQASFWFFRRLCDGFRRIVFLSGCWKHKLSRAKCLQKSLSHSAYLPNIRDQNKISNNMNGKVCVL